MHNPKLPNIQTVLLPTVSLFLIYGCTKLVWNVGLIFLSLNFCGSSSITFDDSFIAFRILYGPMNLGMSFHALCFGKVLDTDYQCISDKSVPLYHPPLYLSIPKVRSYFHHISDTPPLVPVPLVSPFIPMSPVSLISVPMPLWSSRLSHKFSPPHSCLLLFHASTFCS